MSRNASFAQNASGNKGNTSIAGSSNSGSDDKEKAEDGPAKQGKFINKLINSNLE